MRVLFIIFILISNLALADDASSADQPVTRENPATFWPPVGPAANPHITTTERWINFGAVYVVDWAFYLYSQNRTIHDYGSFQNWATNWYQPHFDNDTFQYNLFLHTITGQAYYQFYRSRGYTVRESFLWSFASSLAFEMFIETVTERPSFQDIYQTPVDGTLLGIALEKLSQLCHSTQTPLGHACGYLLNPFTLIPKTPKFALLPEVSRDKFVARVAWEF